MVTYDLMARSALLIIRLQDNYHDWPGQVNRCKIQQNLQVVTDVSLDLSPFFAEVEAAIQIVYSVLGCKPVIIPFVPSLVGNLLFCSCR